MADNYFQYAFCVKGTPQQITKLRSMIDTEIARQKREGIEDGEEELCCQYCTDEQHNNYLHIYEDEAMTSLGPVVNIICRWQKAVQYKEGVIISGAYTCSKPRADEFGGVVELCYRGKSYGFDPVGEAQSKLEALTAKPEKRRK